MDKTCATKLDVEIRKGRNKCTFVLLFFFLANVRLLRLKYKFITTCVTMLLEKHV